MKKVLAVMFACVVAGVVYAGNDANLMHYVGLLSTKAGAATGSAVDVSQYKGNATFVVAWGVGTDTNHTGSVTIQHCATSGGTYTTVTNLAGTAGVMTTAGAVANEVDTFACDLGRLHKYVKAVHAAEGSATNGVAVMMVAPMKSN